MAGGYDDRTDVLTSEGWRAWPDIHGDEEFATLNPQSNALEYQNATAIMRCERSGTMYRVHSEQIDLLVTTDHSLWIQRYDTRAARRGMQPYGLECVTDAMHRRVRYQKTAGWNGRSLDRVEVLGTSRTYVRADTGRSCVRSYPGAAFPIEPFARFLGYYLAEGSINGHQIVLAQNRGPIMDKMVETIRAMGLSAYVPVTGHGQIRTQCVSLRDMLADLGHAEEKRVPSMVHSWSPRIIKSFIAAMIEGDGSTHAKNGHQVIYTISRELADNLQILAIKSGVSANIRVDDRTGLERKMPNGQRFFNLRPCYIVSLVARRNKPLVNNGRGRPSRYWNAEGYHDGIECYSGTVHCAKVPNGLLLVRRGGKPVVSGSLH